MEFILRILIYFIMFVLVLLMLRLNLKTRSFIDDWAVKNKFNIVRKRYIPWGDHNLGAFGPHPSNFYVAVKDSFGQISKYNVKGEGLFLSPESIKLKRIK